MPRVPKQILPPLHDSLETIGQRIAKFRKRCGLTQLQLAQKIGIERTVIANYEKDRLRVYDEMLGHIALALGVSTDSILGLKNVASNTQELSLRLMKRFSLVEQLPEVMKKHVIKMLDDSIKANSTANQNETNPQS